MGRVGVCALGVVVSMLLSVGTGQAAERTVRSKADAPPDLQEVFAVQDDTESRNPRAGIALPGRTFTPTPGLEPGLMTLRIEPQSPALIVATMDRFPSAQEWTRWRNEGVRYVDYLGKKSWLVQLTVDANLAFERTGAEAFTVYAPADKISRRLDRLEGPSSFFDEERHLVVLDVTLLPESSEAARKSIRADFHRDEVTYVNASDRERRLTLVVQPFDIDRLSLRDDVIVIRPGAWRVEPLLDGVRDVASGDEVVDSDGKLLQGHGIRAATNERLGAVNDLDAIHDAFWGHKSSGERTDPRLSNTALETNCWSGSSSHGTMTAGVMLGNGWFSDRYESEELGYRGIAPDATYECYGYPEAHAHVSSHSYISGSTTMNRAVIGDSSEQTHHAHVIAFGNNGRTYSTSCPGGEPDGAIGYYSACNDHKNLMSVGNAQVNGQIYADSSAGPTVDGRIKPDISAPTGNSNTTITAGGFSVDIHRVEIVRDGSSILDWSFLFATPEGWGQTGSILGRAAVEVVPHHGRIEVSVDEAPWSPTWNSTPVVGTEEDRFGTNLVDLDIVGEADDILRVTYQAHGLGKFDLEPVWFRDHPYLGDNCDVPDSACPWYSQSWSGGLGIGDGELRTMEVPIGLSGDWTTGVHPFWDDEETWNGERIEFLGLRLYQREMQPTPSYSSYYNASSGGTSGASPVLGGAYALAMENLTRLYPYTDIDQRNFASVYFTPMAPALVYGMPLNSTWKALFVHTADDMVRTNPTPGTPVNPDTGVANVYHEGPDFSTGYGMVDIQSAIDLMGKKAKKESVYEILEAEIFEKEWHTYKFKVDDEYAAGDLGLKVTLVWDDVPDIKHLVNNLSLLVQAPDGTKYYPWTLEEPGLPVIASNIVPAERDEPNDLDNVELVQVDDVKTSHSGTWQIHVSESGLGDPLFEQRYSLVLSPWDVKRQCHSCE